MDATLETLDDATSAQRYSQWVDAHGTLWRHHTVNDAVIAELGHEVDVVLSYGWQYWDDDDMRWRWYGIDLARFGPYRQAHSTEQVHDD